MTHHTGRCLCGAVHYQLSAEPVMTRICWCRDCQHLAPNGTVNAIVPTAALAVSGVTSEYTNTAASGNSLTRRFCPTCGSQLFANSSARPQFTVVRAGSFDDTSFIRPTANIWTSSAPNWACMDPALEQNERQPAPPPQPTN